MVPRVRLTSFARKCQNCRVGGRVYSIIAMEHQIRSSRCVRQLLRQFKMASRSSLASTALYLTVTLAQLRCTAEGASQLRGNLISDFPAWVVRIVWP